MQTSACTQYGLHTCEYVIVNVTSGSTMSLVEVHCTSTSDVYNHMPYTQQSLGIYIESYKEL